MVSALHGFLHFSASAIVNPFFRFSLFSWLLSSDACLSANGAAIDDFMRHESIKMQAMILATVSGLENLEFWLENWKKV